MKMNADFLTSGPGQLVLVGVVLALGAWAIHARKPAAAAAALPPPRPTPSVPLPKILTREVSPFARPAAPPPSAGAASGAVGSPLPRPLPREAPLGLVVSPPEPRPTPATVTAPYGRLVPCETVVALESNHLETPIVGLVTEDVWHEGRLVIPAGAEVHGRAALDRARERLGSQGTWRIVWRTRGPDNGTELETTALVLDRDSDGARGGHDGSAGLRGQIVKTDDERELKLFAASFLGTATAALQELRPTAGLLGEASVPVATARNAVLAGTGAVLREYADSLRRAIAEDGFYLRVPAGKPFYLYLTQTLDRSAGRQPPAAPPNL